MSFIQNLSRDSEELKFSFTKFKLVRITLIAFGFLSSSSLRGELLLEATHAFYRQSPVTPEEIDLSQKNDITLTLHLILKNTGKTELKIVTTMIGPTEVARQGSLNFVFHFEGRRDEKGQFRIPSDVSLTPVVLNPGESTDLIVETTKPPSLLQGKIKVIYDIDPFLGKRFGFWTGKLEIDSRREGSGIDQYDSKPEREKESRKK
jgi:hypothetical protein